MAATMSRMPNWHSMRTAKCWACACTPLPTCGAYPSTFWSMVPTWLYAPLLSGQYNIPAIYVEVDGGLHQHRARRRRSRRRPARRRPSWSSASSKKRRVRPGTIRPSFGGRTSSPSFPHQTPVVLAYDIGDYAEGARQGAGARGLQGRSPRARQPRPPRASCAAWDFPPISRHAALRRRRAAASSAPASASGNRPRCGSIMVGHGRGSDRFAQPRPRPRDDVRAVGLLAPRHSDGECLDRPRRHRQGADGHGHLRLALGRSRHVGDLQSARQGRGQGEEGRGPPARSRGGRHRVQGRKIHRQGHRQVDRLRPRSRRTPISRTSSTARNSNPA